MEGQVIANRAGFGFLRVEGMVDNIFLPPREMAGHMHGDRVRVTARQGADKRWSGQVDKLLERGVEAFLATVEIHGRNASVHSADRRLSLYCQVAPEHLGGARQGDWVIARVLKYPTDGSVGTARVERLLDPEQPVTLATEAAIARYDLQRGEVAVHDFGQGQEVDEPVFIPRPNGPQGSSAEGDGWLLTYVYDRATDQSRAVLLDAIDIARPPMAEITLPRRVPHGLHGNWVAA